MPNFKPLAILCGCTAWFVSDQVGNPEDRFFSQQGSHVSMMLFSDEAGRSWRHLAMRDKHTHYIANNHVDIMDQTLTEQCHDLVCTSTLYPKVGVARRPAFITFKDPVLAKYV